LLVFEIAGSLFGLKLTTVAEIIRMPSTAHMPLVPPSLLGLANLRGLVLPVLSMRVLLGLPDIAASATTRVIVLRGETPVGLVVDSVSSLLSFTPDQLEHDDAGAGPVNPKLLEGTLKGAEGEDTTKILKPQQLLAGRFDRLGVQGDANAASRSPVAVPAGITESRSLVSMVSFKLGAQEYALPLERVREIIPLPSHVAEVARSESAVLGVVTLRDRLLPLVSLRALLGMPVDFPSGEQSKVIVMTMGEGTVGVVADDIREILRVDPSAIDPAPALMTKGTGDAEISSICRLDQGRRLVALLSPDRLFRSDVIRRILADHIDATVQPEMQTEEDTMADEQFVVFRLGDQDYGMPIAAVSEIARPPEKITRLPKSSAFIDGVMNLRGNVVPIIDLRKRFELTGTGQASTQRILVLSIAGAKAGFLVDSVLEVLKVPAETVQQTPEMSSGQLHLISRVINLGADRMILLVDPAQLLDKIEADVLTQFERSELADLTTVP
jgi:purine-binding chemotaxis protein CheW